MCVFVTVKGKVRICVHTCWKHTNKDAEAQGRVEAIQALKDCMTGKQKPHSFFSIGASLTCLKQGGGVGGALTVVRDGRDMDKVLFTTFEHSDLAVVGG